MQYTRRVISARLLVDHILRVFKADLLCTCVSTFSACLQRPFCVLLVLTFSCNLQVPSETVLHPVGAATKSTVVQSGSLPVLLFSQQIVLPMQGLCKVFKTLHGPHSLSERQQHRQCTTVFV